MIAFDPPELLRLSRIIIPFQGQFTNNLYSPCNLTYSHLLRVRMWTMILQGAMIFFYQTFLWRNRVNKPSHIYDPTRNLKHHEKPALPLAKASLPVGVPAPHRGTPPSKSSTGGSGHFLVTKLCPTHGLNSSKNKTNDFLLMSLQIKRKRSPLFHLSILMKDKHLWPILHKYLLMAVKIYPSMSCCWVAKHTYSFILL